MQKIWIQLPLMVLFLGSSAIAQAAMPGTNLPFLQPYPGSTMEGYVTRQYDELRMPLGPFKTDQSQMQQWPVKSQMVAGQAVYIRYETPKDRSPFEIMSNYRETLQKEGFHVLWQCVSKQCVVAGDTKPSVDRDPVWPVSDRSFGTYFYNNDGRMLTARLDSGNGVQTWVYLWVGGPSNSDGGETRVYAVQTKPMQTGLVQGSSELLTAAAMGQALDQQGRFAMHLPFDYNRATLRPDAMAQIRQLAQALQSHPNWQIGLDGHTDAVGSAAFNQKLSEERAAAVKTALVRLGVPATQLATRGLGATQPVASNTTKEGMAQNRRVEVVNLTPGFVPTLASAPQVVLPMQGDGAVPAMTSPTPAVTSMGDNGQQGGSRIQQAQNADLPAPVKDAAQTATDAARSEIHYQIYRGVSNLVGGLFQ